MKNLFKLLGIALLIGAIGFALGACSSPAGGPPNDGLEGAGEATFGEEGAPNSGTVTIDISPDYTFELVITVGSGNDADTITQPGTYTVNEDNTLTLIDNGGNPVGKATIKDGKLSLTLDDDLGDYGGLEWNLPYDGTEPIEDDGEGGGPGSGPDVIAGLDPELVGKWFVYTRGVDADEWIFEITAAGQLIMTEGALNQDVYVTTSGGKINAPVTANGYTIQNSVDYDVNGKTLSLSNPMAGGAPTGIFVPLISALQFAQTGDQALIDMGLPSLGADGYYHKDVVTSDPGSDPGDEPGDDPGSDPGDGGTGGVNPGPGGSGSNPVTAKFDGIWKGTVKFEGSNYDAYITFEARSWTGQVIIPNNDDMMMGNGSYTPSLTGNDATLKMNGEVLGQVSLKNSRLTITLNNTTPVPGTYTFTPFNGTIPEDTGPGGGTSIEGNWKGSVPGFGDVYSSVKDGHWSVYPMDMEGTYTWNGTTGTLKDEDGYTVGTATLSNNNTMVIKITAPGSPISSITFTRYTGAMPGGEINPDGPPVIEGTWKGTMPINGMNVDVYTNVEDDTWYVSPFDMGGTYTWNGTTATLRDEDGNTVGTAMLQGNNTMVIKITAPGSSISSITLTRSNEVIPGGDSPVKLMEGNWHGTMSGMGDLYVSVMGNTWYLSPFGMEGTYTWNGTTATLRDDFGDTVGTATFNQGNDTMVITISSMPPITLTRYYGEIPGGGVIPGGDYPGVIPGGNYPDGNYPGSLGF